MDVFGKQTRSLTVIILLIAGLITGAANRVSAQSHNADEIVVQFNVPRVLTQDIFALYDGETVYIPVLALFDLLELKIEGNLSQQHFAGFVFDPEHSFEIDLIKRTARLGSDRFELTPKDFFLGSTDFYIRVDLYQELFNLPLQFSFSMLSVTLPFDERMPAYQRWQRKQLREKNLKKVVPTHGLETMPHRRAWLKGGVVDWSLATFHANRGQSMQQLNLSGGAMLAGGDLTLSGNGDTRDGVDLEHLYYRWHYFFSENPYITQFEAGKIFSGGTLSRSMTGAMATNRPQTQRRFYRTERITGNIGVDWEVELYINNRLTDFVRTDQTGDYNFLVDVGYGTTRVTLKMYGPNGENVTEERNIVAPFTLVPKGTLEYTLAVGNEDNLDQKKEYTQGSLHYGVVNNVTFGVMGDMPLKNDTDEKGTALAEATILPFDNLILKGYGSNNYTSGLSASFSKSGSLNLSVDYIKYAENIFRNPARRKSTASFSGSVPVKIEGTELYLRLYAALDKFVSTDAATINVGLNTTIFGVRTNYIGNFRQNKSRNSITKQLDSRFLFSTHLIRYAWPQIRVDYDHNLNQFSRYSIYIGKRVFRSGQISINYDRDPITKSNTFGISFSLNTDFAQFNTRFSSAGEQRSLVQSQHGSVRYNEVTKTVHFDRRNGVGYAMADVRPFMDYNYNGVFDGSDKYYPGVRAKIQGGRMRPVGDEGNRFYYDQLRGYDEYLVQIDELSIDNPTLVPAKKNFKATFNPNMVTAIEVPLVTGGDISGIVRRETEFGQAGAGGVKIQIFSESREVQLELTTFSNGEYYHLGLLPGKYRAFVNPEQLKQAGYNCQPEFIEFEIKPVEGGDSVQKIDFLLTPQ